MPATDRKDPETRLAQRLREVGFVALFLGQDRNTLEELWRDSEGGSLLGQIILDSDVDPMARFLAAEIMFLKLPNYPPARVRPALVKIYAAALKGNFTAMANPWGLPGTLDGLTGQHIVALGKAVVPELKRLLNDTTEVLYGGSQEATFGNSYHYRIKDLAAFFIANIQNVPFRVNIDSESRDKAIEKLRESLGPVEDLA